VTVDYLSADGNTYTVSVDLRDANIPEGAYLQVKELSDSEAEEYIEEAAKAVDTEVKDLLYSKALDISIVYNGEKIQPDGTVKVEVKLQDKKKDVLSEVVHFGDRTEVLNSTTKGNTVEFKTEGFSVFAIVGTETLETTYLTADGETYKITVTYGPEADIPKGSWLKVKEILPGTALYNSYNNQAANKLHSDVNGKEASDTDTYNKDSYEVTIVPLPEAAEIGFARYFDISIIHDNQEIEPKAAVEVKIEYVEPVKLAQDETLQIVHFADDGIEVITPEMNGNEIVFEQKSFSVTATVTTNLSNDGGYALLVQYDGKYYEVLFDGTLEEVTPAGTNSYTVSTAERWTWVRQSRWSNNYNIRVQTNTGYEYIDPAASDGISTTRRTIERTASGNGYYISGGGNYLGVTTDAEGNPVLAGGISGQSNAAVFYFATLTSSVSGLTVDHIDIGVRGSATVSVPLAYGTYYYADGSEAMTVQVGEHVNAKGVNSSVPVTEADLMSATISAYTKDSAGNRTYDNSFIISQYTSSTGSGQAMDQVRIGGTFPIGTVNLSQRAYRGNVEQYITSDNQIFYEVDVTKPVELTLQDSEGNTLYQKDGSGNLVPLTVTVNVTLTSNFSYWDDDNECPGISYFGRNNNGTANLNGSNASGMDFVLGTSDDTDATLAAIEIIKYTVNTDGQLISVQSGGTFNFDIYQNTDGDVTAPTAWSGETTAAVDYNGYTRVSSRSITAGESGYGVSYDYSVDRGLVYIQETGNLDGTTITDTDGNTWDYVETYIETEYVWRNDSGVTHSNVNQNNRMRSIPDVVGDYHSTTYEGELHNTFLEFYVYNIYKGGEVEFKKVDQSGYMIEGATFELYLTDPSDDASAITAYQATSARNKETGLVEVDFGSVAYGTYYMMETDAPEGYVKDTNVYRVEVFEGESGAESCKIERKTSGGWVELGKQNNLYVFPNTPKYVNDFNITKVDENGSQVTGARLKFERLVATESGDQYVDYDFDTSTSGDQSTITVGTQDISLGTGKYRISETGVPTGYERTFDYIYLTVNGETATITLTDASGAAIPGVIDPDDSSKTTYTITNDEDLAIITMDEITTTSEGDDGTTVTSHSYKLQVVNKATMTSVDVTKIVEGKFGNKSARFDFTVSLSKPDGTIDKGWNPEYTVTPEGTDAAVSAKTDTQGNNTGEWTFKLSHNQKITFTNVPVGYTCKVNETDYASEGYTTSYGEMESIKEGEVVPVAGLAVTVTNTKEGTVPTGIHTDSTIWRWLIGACFLMFFGSVLYGRRKRRQ